MKTALTNGTTFCSHRFFARNSVLVTLQSNGFVKLSFGDGPKCLVGTSNTTVLNLNLLCAIKPNELLLLYQMQPAGKLVLSIFYLSIIFGIKCIKL